MEVTDLFSSLGSDLEPDKLQEKANKALNGKHKTDYSFDMNKPVKAKDLLAKPEIKKYTVEEVKNIYPVRISQKVLERVTKIINNSTDDMDYFYAKQYRDNLISFIDIIRDTKHKISFEDYANACKFCTFKLAGNTDIRAFSLTFPDKVLDSERKGNPNSYLYSYATMYSKSKAVTEVMSKLMIPSYIMYQDIFHKAVHTQAEIMLDPKVSPKVRSDAANSLMTHLKQPEIKKAELDIKVNNNDAINSLSEALSNLSGKQRELILEGEYSVKDISETILVQNLEEE